MRHHPEHPRPDPPADDQCPTLETMTPDQRASFLEHCTRMNIEPTADVVPIWWSFGREAKP